MDVVMWQNSLILVIFVSCIWGICGVVCLRLLCPPPTDVFTQPFPGRTSNSAQGSERRRRDREWGAMAASIGKESALWTAWGSLSFPEVLIHLVWSRSQEPLSLTHTAGISYWSLGHRWTFCLEQNLILALHARLCFAWDISLFTMPSFL